MKTVIIPLRIKDTESVSWAKGLVSYLKKSYGSGQWSVFYDEEKTKEIDACRTTANSDLAPESLLEQNYKYAAILEQVYLRLGSHSGALQIDFIWYEAEYHPGLADKKYKQRTVVFEKSSVMYNIGVLLTQIAKKKMSDDYKSAVPYLSRAMACFNYMSNHFLNSPSVDCAAENTAFLSILCHAEAQELFLLTLVNGPEPSGRASLISKLAHTAANLYEECQQYYEENYKVGFGTTVYGEDKWKDIITLKVHLYKAVTAYNQLFVLEESKRIGEAISYGNISLEEIKEAVHYKIFVKEEIDVVALKTVIEDKLKSLIKDNDFIYNDLIPSDVTLESIKTMDAIKPISWEEQIKSYLDDDLIELCKGAFKGIVPMEVYENESIYSEEKASLLRKEVETVETADWEYQSFIEFTDLPKLIKDLESKYADGSGSNIDDPQYDLMRQQIESWSKLVQTNKLKNVNEQLQNIVNRRNEILSVLSNVSPDQKENAMKIKNSLLQASQSDEKIFSTINPYLEEVGLLSNPSLLFNVMNRFQSKNTQPSLLDIDDTKNEQILERLSNIKNNQETLRLLKEERSRNLKDFKESLNNDDITQKLILHTGKSAKDIKAFFEEELDKFKPLSSRIEATIFKQTNLINDIKIKLDEIFKLTGIQDKTPEQESLSKERKEFFDKMEKAYTQFMIYTTDLPKGLSFYDTLLKMAKDISSVNRPDQSAGRYVDGLIPPAVPQRSTQSTSLADSLARMSVRDTSNVQGQGVPAVPKRNYEGVNSSPPIPPKSLPSGLNGLLGEQKPSSGPTSFYNNPSVFDEDLYSKFSK